MIIFFCCCSILNIISPGTKIEFKHLILNACNFIIQIYCIGITFQAAVVLTQAHWKTWNPEKNLEFDSLGKKKPGIWIKIRKKL